MEMSIFSWERFLMRPVVGSLNAGVFGLGIGNGLFEKKMIKDKNSQD
jgi:hypothetical protein